MKKKKEINAQEVFLKAIIINLQLVDDTEALGADIDAQLIADKFMAVQDNTELKLVANKEHEKYLVHIKWKKSSNIKATIYDSLLKRLTVEFNHGGVYDYEGVPKKVYKKFEKASSVGKFLNKVIVPKYKSFKRK